MKQQPPVSQGAGGNFSKYCYVRESKKLRGNFMKRFTLFVLVSSLLAIPLLIYKVRQRVPLATDENMRYDIEDLLTDETL